MIKGAVWSLKPRVRWTGILCVHATIRGCPDRAVLAPLAAHHSAAGMPSSGQLQEVSSMRFHLVWAPALLALLLGSALSQAAAPPVPRRVASAADVQALAEKIDVHIAQRWAKHDA